jgi:aspartate/methionine/tyrosine aminotransferase
MMHETLIKLIKDNIAVNNLPDVEWLLSYINSDCKHGDPILLSIGENWSDVPFELNQLLIKAPSYTHGYLLSMYGLPRLRTILRDYIIKTHNLLDFNECDFEVGVSWTGTRSAMFDYGRYLIEKTQHFGNTTPLVLATIPGWDYSGIFEPLGYKMRYLHLYPELGFEPSFTEFEDVVQSINRSPNENLAVIIINAQHNPTGVNWNLTFVREVIKKGLSIGANFLIDDAYYSIHDPGIKVTSTLKILLEEFMEKPKYSIKCNWMAVRSLGKQFSCNGWSLGAITAKSETLKILVNKFRVQHQFNCLGMLQYAMADWLENSVSEEYTIQQCNAYQQKKICVKNLITSIYASPNEKYYIGECTSYVLFSIPKIYSKQGKGVSKFIHDCFFHTGVMFSSVMPSSRNVKSPMKLDYVRMFIGVDLTILQEAFKRMKLAGITYDMPEILDSV